MEMCSHMQLVREETAEPNQTGGVRENLKDSEGGTRVDAVMRLREEEEQEYLHSQAVVGH